MSDAASDAGDWPAAPIRRLTRPLERFLHIEAASGGVLIACTVLALIAANTPLAPSWSRFWETRLAVSIGPLRLDYPLWYWVNDALMTVFFFVIGMEIKRELVAGELRDRRRVVLPVAAALGGAIVPALIYLALQHGGPGRSGWAIPMATDIAFVVACLSLLGKRVPPGLKVFLLSLAIVDDLLAVTVIALVYTASVKTGALFAGIGGLALVAVLARLGVRRVAVYVVVGAGVWLAVLKSGVHPTVAGAILGLMTPAAPWVGQDVFLRSVERAGQALRGEVEPPVRPRVVLERVGVAAREAVSPLERLEAVLHPWVAFVIMPVFALANAGVAVSLHRAASPVAVAVAFGLVLGKPLGILAASWLVLRLGWARLPERVSWGVLVGAGCLAGIGFTMSLFIAGLSFEKEVLSAAKMGILLGSAASALAGVTMLLLCLRRPNTIEGEPSS